MQKAAVVILNWNGLKFLQQFLQTVIEHSKGVADVIVADNGSNDGSVDWVNDHCPGVEVIQNSENLGFAGGYNQALQGVEHEYYILINSDVEVTPNWIQPVLQLMESDKSIAACQPKLRSFDEREKFEYAGAAGGFIDYLGYPFCRGRVFQHLETDSGQHDETREIFWATGACLFIRKEYFREAGGFDPDFFAHMEEIDLCWRLRNMGHLIYCCPKSIVYHVGGGTLHKSNPKKTFLNFRNSLLTLHKNAPKGKVFPRIMVRLLLDSIAGLKFLFTDGFDDLLAVIKAHWSYFGLITKTNIKRRQLRAKLSKYNTRGIYKGSIVWEHYAKKRHTFDQLKNW